MPITAAGFTREPLSQIQSDFLNNFDSVFTYTDPQTNITYSPSLEPEDLLGAFALILADLKDELLQDNEDTYYSIFPQTALGVSLDRAIIPAKRKAATSATTTVIFYGVAGTVINAGFLVENETKLSYALKSSVTIGSSGAVAGVVTCTTPGKSGNTAAGSISFIPVPKNGLVSVSNPTAADNATDTESDSVLRPRAINQLGAGATVSLQGIEAAVAGVSGVTAVSGYENDTPGFVNGVPPGGIAIVVEGGADADIAAAIFQNTPAGQPTYGSTTVFVTDQNGNPFAVNFTRIVQVPIFVDVVKSVNAIYDAAVSDNVIREQILKYIGGIDPSSTVYAGLSAGSTIYAWKAKGTLFELNNPNLLPGLIDATVTIGLVYTSGMAEPASVLAMLPYQRPTTSFIDITVR